MSINAVVIKRQHSQLTARSIAKNFIGSHVYVATQVVNTYDAVTSVKRFIGDLKIRSNLALLVQMAENNKGEQD